MRILVIEDEERLALSIKKGFEEFGYAVDMALDGEEGFYLASHEVYDAIILDLMLPKKDGVTICSELRQSKVMIPILMLTAKSTVEDRVKGLDTGADDYLTKPFAFTELRSRVQALIRRNSKEIIQELSIADLSLDPTKHVASRNKKGLNLTPKEFSILELLLRHKDEVVTRTMIMEHVWDYNFDSMSNVVDVFVASLRKKVDKNSHRKLIQTIHGVGYKISEAE